MGEHLPCKQGVRSSILLVSTKCSLKTAQKKKESFSEEEKIGAPKEKANRSSYKGHTVDA